MNNKFFASQEFKRWLNANSDDDESFEDSESDESYSESSKENSSESNSESSSEDSDSDDGLDICDKCEKIYSTDKSKEYNGRNKCVC